METSLRHHCVRPFAGCNLQEQNSPEEACEAAKGKGLKQLWLVGGGELTAELFANDLVDRLILTQMPILLGSGIPICSPRDMTPTFSLESSRTTTTGISQLTFKVIKRDGTEEP